MPSLRHRLAGWLLAASLAFATTAHADGLVTEQVAVSGAVKRPLVLTLEELKAFPDEQVGSVTVKRRVDDREVDSRLRGVRLSAVVERAGLTEGDANQWKRTVVLVTASDGYGVAFSWPELVNAEAGRDVLVVFERDGQPLADREGRIALVSARDLRTGPRSVRWLAKIDVRVLRD